MLRVEPALFSNVITSVQRTGNLTGGAIRGLPGGVVIGGLQGISSFGADVAEAQKEFRLGRIRPALERVKQMESNFNGIAGRWNASVGSVISSARQGRQQLSLQKLNEVKAAQTRMQQLIGSASKAFQDLVSALEHAVAAEGRQSAEDEPSPEDDAPEQAVDPQPESVAVQQVANTVSDAPDLDLIGHFSEKYGFGPRLEIQKDADDKARIVPPLEPNKFYFFAGLDPPSVLRVRELQRKAVLVFDTGTARELLIESRELKNLIRDGIWLLV